MISRSRQIRFHPGAVREWSGLADAVQQRVIYQFERLRRGERPTHWKPLSGIGSGVIEIRIRNGRAFRVLCATGFDEVIYVLMVFEKKSRKMPRRLLELARRRYRQLVSGRSARGDDEGTE
jgi:phage-related protein